MLRVDIKQRYLSIGRFLLAVELHPNEWAWGVWQFPPRSYGYDFVSMRGLALGPLDLCILPKVTR